MMDRLLVLSLMIFVLWMQVDASHFRGGTVSWKHRGQVVNAHNVEVNFRFGWRRDSDSNFPCDDDTIRNQTPAYNEGTWTGHNVTQISSTNATSAVICTVYETIDNWAYGYNSFLLTVITPVPFHLSHSGNAWIDGTVHASGRWSLAATNIDLEARSDTGLVNNPPITFSIPIVKLTQGCSEDVIIRYQDDDNDRVTCRYAVSGRVPDECAGACNGPLSTGYPHFILNQTACTIRYDGGGATALVAVSLVLEDHPRSTIVLGGSRTATPSDSLSQIPLQFLMQIHSGTSCNVVPTYPPQTINDNEQITIPRNGGMTRTLYAYSSSGSTAISQFVVIGPLGMQTHSVASLGNNLYSARLSWAPASNQGGTHTVCYYATDSGGSRGKQICFTVTVAAVSDACAINNGGCSDICTSSGSYRTCACSIPCWTLDIDGETCVPDMTINCNGQGMRISVADCASNRTVVAGNSRGQIRQQQCQSTHIGNRHVLNWNASTCGLGYEVNPVQVQYAGNLWVWHGIDTGSSVIVRGEYRRVPVICTISSTFDVSASFVPELPFNNESFPVDVSLEGFGDFSLFFDFYRSSAYSSVISPSEYPMSVTVNDRLYFSVGAIGQPGFTFFTQECLAVTSSPDPTQPPLTYTFIRDGCFLDPTLIRFPTSNPMEDKLSLEAFDFAEKITATRINADISIQCKIMICDASNATARCYQGCATTSRKKRSIFESEREGIEDGDDDNTVAPRPNDPDSPLQDLKGRFILVGDIESLGVTSESSNYLYWALIGIGILLLAVALFIANRVMKLKRNRSSQIIYSDDIGHHNKAANIEA